MLIAKRDFQYNSAIHVVNAYTPNSFMTVFCTLQLEILGAAPGFSESTLSISIWVKFYLQEQSSDEFHCAVTYFACNHSPISFWLWSHQGDEFCLKRHYAVDSHCTGSHLK